MGPGELVVTQTTDEAGPAYATRISNGTLWALSSGGAYWMPLTGGSPASPSIIGRLGGISKSAGSVDVVGLEYGPFVSNNYLWGTISKTSGGLTFSGWYRLGSNWVSEPVLITTAPSTLDLFGITAGGTLQWASFQSGYWTAPASVAFTAGYAMKSVSAVPFGISGESGIVVKEGTGGSLWWRTVIAPAQNLGSNWGQVSPAGSYAFDETPGLTVSPFSLEMVARGSEGRVYHRWYDTRTSQWHW